MAAMPLNARMRFPGILLISLATLLLEIAWMRILSVSLFYHFAFMVLSTALFGFGFAGLLLSGKTGATPVSSRFVARSALATPLAFALGYTLSNLIPFEPFSLGLDPAQWLYLPLFQLAVTLPFFFSGLTIAALIARHAEAVHRLYFFDLLGAGLGAILVVVCLPTLGGTGTMWAAAGLAALGAALIAFEVSRGWALSGGLLALTLLILAPFGDALMPVRVSRDKTTGDGVPLAKVFADPRFHRLTAWNATARIDVIEYKGPTRRTERTIFIDGGTAMTRLAHPSAPLATLTPSGDEESFFMRRAGGSRVLVVGAGGGREVLLALRNGAHQVTAVEINPDINDVVSRRMTDFTGHLYQDPRVAFFTDEARRFLDRSRELFDVIHCPHTISNAAMASGSLSLAENYLMTLEAFEAYLDHLTPNGVLIITRPEAHLPRVLSTLRRALEVKAAGALASRVVAWRRPETGESFYAGVAFRKSPFSETESRRFAQTLKRQRLEPLYLPPIRTIEPYDSLVRGVALNKVPLPFAAILEPATDEKPFFNRRVSFLNLRFADLKAIFSRGTQGRMALEDRPVTEVALLVLVAESALIALLMVAWPLVFSYRRARPTPGRRATYLAFFAVGLAYITVEVGLIHRFTLYLGRPAVVLSAVLSALLIGSGIGSAIAGSIKHERARWGAPLAAALACLIAAGLIPSLIAVTLSTPEPVRITLAALTSALVGLFMGMPFPLLIKRLQATHPERIPAGFGINGLASVVGTIAALVIAMSLGQSALLITGATAYLAAALAARSVP